MWCSVLSLVWRRHLHSLFLFFLWIFIFQCILNLHYCCCYSGQITFSFFLNRSTQGPECPQSKSWPCCYKLCDLEQIKFYNFLSLSTPVFKVVVERDYTKLKSFCTAKEIINKRKTPATEWEKIFANDTANSVSNKHPS